MIHLLYEHARELRTALLQHIYLSVVATLIAVGLGIPLGILCVKVKSVQVPVLGFISIIQTIPSLAMLTFLLPILGIGVKPAIVALALYALLPIVRNVFTALSEASPDLIEMAKALGGSPWQRLKWIEMPLAMPLIVAGIRTAAVISVGTATLSAFIGAGGLGDFINRGLALNNTQLVLLGAIPAALLALYVDYLLAICQHALVRPFRAKFVYAEFALAIAIALFVFFGLNRIIKHRLVVQKVTHHRIITVGSKNFTEQLILGNMLADLLQSHGYSVKRKLDLAGTSVCQAALLNHGIDMYVEYTGTAYSTVLKRHGETNPQVILKTVQSQYKKRFDLDWLPPLGFANTYAIAVRRADALRQGWKTISDLVRSAHHMTAGFTSEFLARRDGYPGLSKAYGLRFGRTLDMSPGLMYSALVQHQVDVISAFSTDGRISADHLKLLADNRHFFPPYDASIVVRGQVYEHDPEIRKVLNSLDGKLNLKTMQKLNYSVDGEHQAPAAVAKQWLIQKGMISGSH